MKWIFINENVVGYCYVYVHSFIHVTLLVITPLNFPFICLSIVWFFFCLRQLYTLTELQRLYDELVASADTCQLDRDAAEKPVRYRFISSGIYLASCWYVSSNLEAYSFMVSNNVQASEFNLTFFFAEAGGCGLVSCTILLIHL